LIFISVFSDDISVLDSVSCAEMVIPKKKMNNRGMYLESIK